MKIFFGSFALRSMALGLALGAWSMGPAPASAAQSNSNLTVTATVVDECALAATTLAFGTYSSGVQTESSAVLDVTCQGISSAWTITFGEGDNKVGPCQRRMFDGNASYLNYNLYSDPAHTVTLEPNPSGTCLSTDSIAGTGSSPDPSVYGTIPSGQLSPNGAYTDTVVMTISF